MMKGAEDESGDGGDEKKYEENWIDEKQDKIQKRKKRIRNEVVGEAGRGGETVEEEVYRQNYNSLLTYDRGIISIFKISFLVALCPETPSSIQITPVLCNPH